MSRACPPPSCDRASTALVRFGPGAATRADRTARVLLDRCIEMPTAQGLVHRHAYCIHVFGLRIASIMRGP